MLAKMARSAPSAAVRSVNGDDSRPRRQPGLPKRGENAKIRGGSEFIRRIPVRIKHWGLTRRFEYSYSPMELVTDGDSTEDTCHEGSARLAHLD